MRYYRPKQRIISGNLPFVTNDSDIYTTDLENQILVDQLIEISDIRDHFIAFSFGPTPKSNGK